MNPDTLVVVHCYSGDELLVQQLLPIFLHHECPVLVLSPEDSAVTIDNPRVENATAGKKGWKGEHTLYRQLEHWKLALQRPQSWFLLNDADSACLSPDLPPHLYADPNKFWCNVLCHENEHLESDRPNLNPPYFMHRIVLEAMVKRAEEMELPEGTDFDGYNDQLAIDGFYTRLIINELHVSYENYPDGATTWPRGIQDLHDHVKSGARFIHGVKHSLDAQLMVNNYHVWRREHMAVPEEASFGFGDTVTI